MQYLSVAQPLQSGPGDKSSDAEHSSSSLLTFAMLYLRTIAAIIFQTQP